MSDDVANTSFANHIELAARDLYQAAIDAGTTGTAWPIFVRQHASYAQRLAGLIGASANTADAALFESRKAAFTGDRPANAAFDLENTLAATQGSLLGVITNNNVANAIASIASMESHQAAYFAERSGRGDNYDALFVNTAAPLTPAVGS